MFSRVSRLLLFAAVIPVEILTAQAPAIPPTKVAIINAQKAVADTQEMKKTQAALEAKYRPRTQEIQSLQNQIQNIQQQLSTPNLSPEREAQLRSDGTLKQKQLQRLSEDLQSDLNNERQDILGRAGRLMTDVVKKIAEARGIDIVIDVTNTLYYKPALDITAEATSLYDKAYPPK